MLPHTADYDAQLAELHVKVDEEQREAASEHRALCGEELALFSEFVREDMSDGHRTLADFLRELEAKRPLIQDGVHRIVRKRENFKFLQERRCNVLQQQILVVEKRILAEVMERGTRQLQDVMCVGNREISVIEKSVALSVLFRYQDLFQHPLVRIALKYCLR